MGQLLGGLFRVIRGENELHCSVLNLKLRSVIFWLAYSTVLMPTVLRIGPYRFHFYSAEGVEPPHIHVERDDLEAKFWLNPLLLARNYGFPPHEINQITLLVFENQTLLLNKYNEYHLFK